MNQSPIAAMVLVLIASFSARAELVDHGSSGEYFYQESTGLYWFDPAEWFNTPRATVQSFVDSTTRWRWATSAEIDSLVGEPAAGGVLEDVMGERSRSLSGNASRWHGFYAEASPSGWLVQDNVADGFVLTSSGFQGGLENLANAGAWLVSEVDPELLRITFDGIQEFVTLANPYEEDGLLLERISCGTLIARFMPVATPGVAPNSNPCLVRLSSADGGLFSFVSATLTRSGSASVLFTGYYADGSSVEHTVTLNNDFFDAEHFFFPDSFRAVESVEFNLANIFADDFIAVPEPSLPLALLPGVLLLRRLRSSREKR